MRAGTRQVAVLNPAQPRTLVHDTFTDSNGTAIAAHVIRPVNTVGASWTAFGDGCTIDNNQAKASGNFSGGILDAGTSDVEISITFTMNNWLLVRGRYQDATHNVYVHFTTTSLTIVDLQGTGLPQLATQAITLTDGVVYTARVVFSGSTVTAYINNVVLRAEGVASQATLFGFSTIFQDSLCDDFILRTVPQPAADDVNLRNGLVAYWPMSEASGDRADAHGGHTLTDSAGAASNTGIVYANALDLPAADNKALTTAGGDFEFGDNYFTVGLWLYPYSWSSAGQYRPVVGLTQTSGAGGWGIKMAFNGALAFGVANGSGIGYAHAQDCAINTWHCCLFWHDPVANTVNGLRGNVALESYAWTGGMTNSGQVLTVGAYGALENTDYRLGPVAVWRRLLTTAEKARWFNWGAGAPYAGLR